MFFRGPCEATPWRSSVGGTAKEEEAEGEGEEEVSWCGDEGDGPSGTSRVAPAETLSGISNGKKKTKKTKEPELRDVVVGTKTRNGIETVGKKWWGERFPSALNPLNEPRLRC